jgi:hypothetical protein
VSIKKKIPLQPLGTGAPAYNPSYSKGRDLEDHSSRTAWAKGLQDSIFSTDKKLSVVVHVCHPNCTEG